MVTLLYTEAWRDVRWNVGMPLLVSGISSLISIITRGQMKKDIITMSILQPLVLLDKVQVVPADNDGPHHLGTVASASKNTTLMDTLPVNGHFLSMYVPANKSNIHQ